MTVGNFNTIRYDTIEEINVGLVSGIKAIRGYWNDLALIEHYVCHT